MPKTAPAPTRPPAKDPCARVRDLTRFAEADAPAISALLDACSPVGDARSLSAETVKSYVNSLYSISSKCLRGKQVAQGVVSSACGDDRISLRKRMRKEFPNPATYATMLNAIASLFNHASDALEACPAEAQAFWRTEVLMASAAARERRMNNVASVDLRGKWFRLDDLDTAIETAREHVAAGRDPQQPRTTAATLNMRLLWLVIARFTPPHRRDYGRLRILKAMREVRDGENAIVVHRTGRVTAVLQEYKTGGAYGRFEHKMPDNVATEVRASLDTLPREYLFTKQDGSAMGDVNFGDVFVKGTFERHLGKPATMNTLRRVWVDHIKRGDYTWAEREDFAKVMNHSLMTQIMHYETVHRDA